MPILLALALVAAPAPKSPSVAKDTGQVLIVPGDAGFIHRLPDPGFKPTVAYQWLDTLLEASGRDADRNSPRPTILSRTMAVTLTAMYDAWAAYDDKAVGTRLGGKLRRPAAERTQANKEKAISYAAYRTLLFMYPDDAAFITGKLKSLGYDPADASTDPKTPAGVGNAAASALIEYRAHDGANQLGDEKGGSGKPYADYSGYKPVNTPDHVVDATRWMPIPFSDKHGGTISPGFLTPFWGQVKPFLLTRGDQFRPPPPPKWGSPELKRDVEEVVNVGGHLTLEQKTVVEFMREGPHSTGQSGHWLQFAEDVSRRDHQTLDQDVKLFFAVSNVVMDAFIACWESKRFYDTSRPYWWARMIYKGKKIPSWLGPGKGFAMEPGEQWRPFSPDEFLTPPFPGYVSGHASASGAGSRMLELFTGSDRYGATAIQSAGWMTEPDASTAQMQARDGKPASDVPESKEIRIELPTFTRVAEVAALSRMWGGYHIRTDNEEGLILGRKIAMYEWPKFQAYFDGTAR